MHTSVCGFFRMGQMVLSEKNLENAFITEQGRIMVIRRSLELADLGIFRNAAKQPGFAIMCDELISNFVTCELSSGDIFQTIENAEMNNV